MNHKGKKAVAYLRTSSPANASTTPTGASKDEGLRIDKDSDKRQRAAVTGFAKANGFEIVDEFYDVVSGADPIDQRTGFKKMLDRIAGNGVRTILVESPDRFARDLAVQLAGHDYLRSLGVDLVPASAPSFFLEDTPTAVLVRQVLGAISQFEKTSLVARLKSGRARKRAAGGRGEGRWRTVEHNPEAVALARQLRRKRPKGGVMSYRRIAAELARQGHRNSKGKEFSASSIRGMVS